MERFARNKQSGLISDEDKTLHNFGNRWDLEATAREQLNLPQSSQDQVPVLYNLLCVVYALALLDCWSVRRQTQKIFLMGEGMAQTPNLTRLFVLLLFQKIRTV